MTREFRETASIVSKLISYFVIPLLSRVLEIGWVSVKVTVLGIRFASIRIETIPKGDVDDNDK